MHFGLNDIHDLPRLEEFGDLIGETINDDLVQAIQHAEPTPESAEVPIDEETSEQLAAQVVDDVESSPEETQLESTGDQQRDE